MNTPLKQHLIDPEICIRCYTCEMSCPLEAIEHNDNNVVVDASKCNQCMDCIPVCPTGSIDEWRIVNEPYSLDEQYEWEELPEQGDVTLAEHTESELANPMDALLAEAHQGAGGKTQAPTSASTPTVNLYPLSKSIEAVVQGNYRITDKNSDTDVRHIILDFRGKPFPILEGQSLGILPPGMTEDGKSHLPRLYSASSPRDGERPGFHNVSLTVKRDASGICSNYLCDLRKGDTVNVIGPYGSTFLLPTDPNARLLMICTGTGSAPMRAFTMGRERTVGEKPGGMVMFFGARTPEELPYFGPLEKISDALIQKHLVFSRLEGKKEYVQDRMREQQNVVAELIQDSNTHIYICGLKDMEQGVEAAFGDIATTIDTDWHSLKNTLRTEGRYHVETY